MAKQRLSVEQFIATGKSNGGAGTEIEFSEFLTGSGVGGAKWRKTGVTGATPVSQTPVDYYDNSAKPGYFVDSVGDEWKLVVNIFHTNAYELGMVNNDTYLNTKEVQLAIYTAKDRNNLVVKLPALHSILIGSSGYDVPGLTGREYGLLLVEGVVLEGAGMYATEIKVADATPIDAIVTDTTSKFGIGLRDLTINGNAYNQDPNQVPGFNLWARNIDGLTLENVRSLEPSTWGIRIQDCLNVSLNVIRCIHGPHTNTDGLHFVDTSYVTGNDIYIYTEGDDGFIIESLYSDVSNYTIDNLYVSPDNQIGLFPRGILMFLADDLASQMQTISNINITNAILENVTGTGIGISRANFENINIDATIKGGCANFGALLSPGSSNFPLTPGILKGCNFNINIQDIDGAGVSMVNTNGVIRDNFINITSENPGNDKTNIAIVGENWRGCVKSNYNPNGDKTLFQSGVVISGSNNSLQVDSTGSNKNIVVQSGSDNTNIILGDIVGSETYDVEIQSGALDVSFTLGEISTLNDQGSGLTTWSNVRGATFKKLISANMDTNGDGTVTVPHDLVGIPSYVNPQFRNNALNHRVIVSGSDATNITLRLIDQSNNPVITGSFNVYLEASI